MLERVQKRFNRLVELWWKYERHLLVGGLLLGFVFDLIIADRPDSTFNNIWLLTYLALSAGLIVALDARQTRRAEVQEEAHPLLLLFGLQVCFGALSSNLLVLYLQSGTFAGSAIFLGVLAALVVGNEFLRTHYGQLRLNVAIYYFLLLSYCIIAVPTFFLLSIGWWQFLVSAAVSLGVITCLLFIVRTAGPRAEYARKFRESLSVVLGICAIYTGLYFANIIPPVPLSLTNIGVYHSVTPQYGDYVLTYEEPSWLLFWEQTSHTYTLTGNRTAFCFSSVFAPTRLTAPIAHKWEQYNEATGRWEMRARVLFPIAGGRDEGYRGYSQTKALSPGKWRCNVETQAGALIGRFSFEVVEGAAPELSQRTY